MYASRGDCLSRRATGCAGVEIAIGGKHCIPRPSKDGEYRIPLSVHDLTVGFLEGGAEQVVVGRKDVRVAITQLLQQARGPLDVGEEEGDRPGWQAGHARGLRALSMQAAYTEAVSAVLTLAPGRTKAPLLPTTQHSSRCAIMS